MESNGAIICFQKYTIGWNGHPSKIANQSSMLPPSPLCIGYFNRVDVKPIDDFRDYVKQASKHEANRVCSRNQLLIRKFMPDGDKDSRDYEILHRSIKLRQEGDLKRESRDAKLPFVDEDGNEYAFACCSLISISRKTHGCSCKSLREISFQVLNCLKYATNDACVKYGIFGVLGTEDMCLIVLSNSFQTITDTVSVVEGFCCEKHSNSELQNNRCGACHTDNMHSILMLNIEKFETENGDEGALYASLWGKDSTGKEPRAEIRFSLRTSAGLKYLNDVTNRMKAAYSQEDIELYGCSGEYDALLRCPAKILVPHLLGDRGEFRHNNKAYHKGVYQSETFLYPFGLSKSSKEPPNEQDKYAADMFSVVDVAVTKIKKSVESRAIDDNEPDFDYLELPLWRLLKDFWNFASFPMDETLRKDQEIQFKASINAICTVAERYGKGGYKDRGDFLKEFNKIITAISGSLQAASQRSRWNFQEQQSYIQNIGSYYKILSTYYGLVKDYIHLIYQIERKEDVEQPLLVPIITFGVTPIIQSYSYDSFLEVDTTSEKRNESSELVTIERKAKLIHIILPYQAMAKPPKYIGTLAHELFHYSAPYDRSRRNEIILKTIIGVAVTEFISILARCCGYSGDMNYWREFFFKCKTDKELFHYLCGVLLEQTKVYIAGSAATERPLEKMRFDNIGEILPGIFYFTKDETNESAYLFYFMIWSNIRHMMQQNQDEYAQSGAEWDEPLLHRMMFGLEGTPTKNAGQDLFQRMLCAMHEYSDTDYEREVYFQIIRKANCDDIERFHKLLWTVYFAFQECPADIFDLETVMWDCGGDQAGRYKKITQYLWQIQGAKSAARSNRKNRKQNPAYREKRPDEDKELTKNDIRIAMVVQSYLKDGETLDAVLRDWAPAEGKYAPKFGYAKDEFQDTYDQVMARFAYLLEDYSEICKGIRDRVSSIIQNNKECREKVKCLGTHYKRFYIALYERQREVHGAATEEIFRDNMFQICWRMIEEYSFNQRLFDISVDTSGKSSVNNLTSQAELKNSDSLLHLEQISQTKATYAADIMWKVSEAVREMSLKDKRPILWYRGQEDRDWDTLPNIMRLKSDAGTDGFLEQLRNELHMAKAYIMPTGENFSDAEWLAYMQHYEFKTNLLDFSESLYPALYFATETWSNKEKPSKDAVVMLFNPVLFNLVMSVLEEHDNNPDSEAEKLAQKRLQEYLAGKRERYEDLPLLAKEPIDDQYRFLFDYKSFTDESKVRYPRAAMVPRHNERMTKQYGEFVFYGLNTKKKKGGLSGYKDWSLESLQRQYVNYFQSHRTQLYGLEDVQEERDVFVPFLYRIDISARHHGGFKEILASLGIRKYTVYPEYDKLAKDLAEQLYLE